MNINELANDCLFLILSNVTIATFSDSGDSMLGNLGKCRSCFEIEENRILEKDSIEYSNSSIPKCLHLHEKEIIGIKMLKLVCKKWKYVIDKRFKFESGPIFILPF